MRLGCCLGGATIAFFATPFIAGTASAANSWTPASTGFSDYSVSALVTDPAFPLAAYAGTPSGISARGVAIASSVVVVTPDTPPPSGRAALDWIDSRFRRPLGLPDLGWSAALAAAAANHARYIDLNPATAHLEVPGRPGFTGTAPSDRCTAAGFPDSCGEVVGSGVPLGATKGWMLTPYHGLPFLNSTLTGIATGQRSAVGTLSDTPISPAGLGSTAEPIDPDAPVNTTGAAVRMWPYEGASDVPLTWAGGEIPEPLTGYTGDARNVGPVLFAWTLEGATVTLDGPEGRVPLVAPASFADGEDPRLGTPIASTVPRDASVQLAIGAGWSAFFAATYLRPRAQYLLTAVTPDGRSYQTRFSTDRFRGFLGPGVGRTGPPASRTIDLSDSNDLHIETSWDGNLILRPTFPRPLLGGSVRVTVRAPRTITRTLRVRKRAMTIVLRGAARYRYLRVEPLPSRRRPAPIWVAAYDSAAEDAVSLTADGKPIVRPLDPGVRLKSYLSGRTAVISVKAGRARGRLLTLRFSGIGGASHTRRVSLSGTLTTVRFRVPNDLWAYGLLVVSTSTRFKLGERSYATTETTSVSWPATRHL